MYFTDDDILHFTLDELKGVCTLVSVFDDRVAMRIQDVWSYHKNILHEVSRQPLQLHISEIKARDYRRLVQFKTVLQPEFIFSDDEEIF